MPANVDGIGAVDSNPPLALTPKEATMFRHSRLAVIAFCVAFLAGCGTSNNPKTAGSITLSPNSAAIKTGETQQFTATASGSSSTAVIWYVNLVAGGNSTAGTIVDGLYKAPASVPTPATVFVSATSAADSTVSSSAAPVTISPGGFTISGTVSKGPLAGATVTAYAVNADGSNGDPLGSTTTDDSGNFSLSLSGSPAGAVRVVAHGGSYKSEADGTTVTGTSDVSALLDSVTSNVTGLSVTPLTLFVDSLTVNNINAGGSALRKLKTKAHPAAEASEGESHASANSAVAGFFGLSGDSPLESIHPKFGKSDISGDPDGFKVGLALGTLSLLGKKIHPASRDDLVGALGKDLTDGKFDGKDKGGPIHLGDSGDLLPPTAGTTDFLTALNEYIETGDAILTAGITPEDVAGAVGDIAGGVSSSGITPPAVGLSAGSSGAVGTMSFGGKQYVFIAARTNGVAVIDVTNPTSPTSKMWPSVYTDLFSGQDIGGVIPVVGTATHPQVLTFAYGSKHAALLNAEVLVSGTPGVDDANLIGAGDFQGDLPLVAIDPVYFSGGDAYIAGGIPDNGRKGVWLATADGYAFFDLTTNTLTTLYPCAPGGCSGSDPLSMLAENLGGDIGHNLLLAGNYSGVQLVDLLAAKSYYMDPTYFSTNVEPLLGNTSDVIDGDAVDSRLRVGIFTSEDTNTAAFLNLATIVKTESTNSFVPASDNGFVGLTFDNTYPPTFSGSAVDSTSHLALFMAGYSSSVGVGQLEDPATAPSGGWKGLSDWSTSDLNDASALGGYCIAADPHAAGVVYNLAAGRPFGYLLDGCGARAIQIDMSGFLALPRAGTTGDAAHELATGTDPAATGGPVKAIQFGP